MLSHCVLHNPWYQFTTVVVVLGVRKVCSQASLDSNLKTWLSEANLDSKCKTSLGREA